MTPAERLHWRILHRHKEGVEADIDELIQPGDRAAQHRQHEAAVDILNTVLLPAMKEVGDKFGAGELILPFVLQSAEVMKKAVAHLENYLERKEGVTKGTVVLATVYGDVHDIGKNLVKTILANNGYTVIDLGKQVPAETIITKAVEVKADAIGLSALLVSTSKQMPLIVNELQRRGLNFPVLIGGAAINRRFGWRILFTESGEPVRAGRVLLQGCLRRPGDDGCADRPSSSAGSLLEQLRSEMPSASWAEPLTSQKPAPADSRARRRLPPAELIPRPPAWGPRVVREHAAGDGLPAPGQERAVPPLLGRQERPRRGVGEAAGRVRAAAASACSREALRRRLAAAAGRLRLLARPGGWRRPAALRSEPRSRRMRPLELTRFHFPRQPAGDYLCLADYFAPVDSGRMDVVALQVVTVGQEATERFDRLQAGRRLLRGLFHPRAGGADRRSHRRIPAPAHPPRAGAGRRGRASAIPGATRPSRSWTTTARCSSCCPQKPSWACASPAPTSSSRSSPPPRSSSTIRRRVITV